MIWWAIAGAGMLIVIILALVFALAKVNKTLGGKEAENEKLKQQIKTLRNSLALRVAADPTLDDLASMFDDT